MYPASTVKRVALDGNIKDYGFDLIVKRPTYNDLRKWGITMPRGNEYTLDVVYQHALKCVKKHWNFYVPKGFIETFDLQDGHFTADIITPERMAKVWMCLAMYESGDRDNAYFPRQFFTDIDVEYKGTKRHFDIVPLFARNIVNGYSQPNFMSAGCLAYGIGNISAYAGIISDKEMAYRAAWDWKYNVELSIKIFSRKWDVSQSHEKGLPLDAAVVYYHGWDGKSGEITTQYLARTELDKKGKEKRSSKRYYDNVMRLYKEYFMKQRIEDILGKIGVRGGHAVGDNTIPAPHNKDYPVYSEGTYVHELSKAQSNEFGWPNLEPETEKLAWSVIAKRGADAGCNTIIYNHTNYSEKSNGELNSGAVVIIYPFENEEYKSMYEKMAALIADYMGLPRYQARIRMSTEYADKNYYSAIHQGIKYGIEHPLIVENGYHIDLAGREEERTRQIIAAWHEILGSTWDADSIFPIRKGCKDEELVKKIQKALLALNINIDLGDYGPDENGVDGDFGDITEAGVKLAEHHFELKKTGEVDETLYYLLFPDEIPEDESVSDEGGIEVDELTDDEIEQIENETIEELTEKLQAIKALADDALNMIG